MFLLKKTETFFSYKPMAQTYEPINLCVVVPTIVVETAHL